MKLDIIIGLREQPVLLFLEEQLRGLSSGSVTTGGGVVGTILLGLQVENCRDRPTMFPHGCINVVRGGKVLTSLVEVASRVAFRWPNALAGPADPGNGLYYDRTRELTRAGIVTH